MQKKLYFLDEQEKNRILNLHESRTHGQYLLNEAIDRKTFTKKVDDICAAGTYGRGNFTDEKIKKDAEVMTRNFSGTRKSNEGLRTIADNIRKLNSIGNYCRVAKKYKELGGRGSSLTDWTRTFVYMDNAWELYIKQPLEELIKNSEALKQKSDAEYMNNPTDTIVGWDKYPCVPQQKGAIDYESRQTPTDTTNWIQVGQFVYSKEGKKFKDGDNKNQTDYSCETEFKTQQPATNYQKVAGGYVGNAFSGNVVKQLRDTVGITGEGGLSQNDINQLYAKISALPNKQ